MRFLVAASFVACASATNAVGTAFLEANQKRPNVVTLPSGLQYRIIETGTGTEHPFPDTEASCHYEGRTASNYPNGKTFDSSFARGEPASFAPSGVIRGWTEAMQSRRLAQRRSKISVPFSCACNGCRRHYY